MLILCYTSKECIFGKIHIINIYLCIVPSAARDLKHHRSASVSLFFYFHLYDICWQNFFDEFGPF